MDWEVQKEQRVKREDSEKDSAGAWALGETSESANCKRVIYRSEGGRIFAIRFVYCARPWLGVFFVATGTWNHHKSNLLKEFY